MNKSDKHVCPHCEGKYILGVNGTINGCDECLGIIRNLIDNTIIDEGLNWLADFDADSLTDMEKA